MPFLKPAKKARKTRSHSKKKSITIGCHRFRDGKEFARYVQSKGHIIRDAESRYINGDTDYWIATYMIWGRYIDLTWTWDADLITEMELNGIPMDNLDWDGNAPYVDQRDAANLLRDLDIYTTPVYLHIEGEIYRLDVPDTENENDGIWELIGNYDDIYGTDWWHLLSEDNILQGDYDYYATPVSRPEETGLAKIRQKPGRRAG